MSTVAEIKTAFERLPKRDQCKLAEWVQEKVDIFEEYGVTAEEVEAAHRRDLESVRAKRKAGKLKPWKPGL